MTWQSLGIWGLEGLQKIFYATINSLAKAWSCFRKEEINKNNLKTVFFQHFSLTAPSVGCERYIKNRSFPYLFLCGPWYSYLYNEGMGPKYLQILFIFLLLWAEVEQIVSRTCCDHNFSRSTLGWLCRQMYFWKLNHSYF